MYKKTVVGGGKNSQYCRHESQLTSGSGYLSSGLVQTNGEGTQWCPWTLSNSGHQRFNITLFKFTPFESSPLTSSSSVCFEIGTIQEGSLSQGILSCGGDARTKTVYISKGGPVKLYFKDKNFLKDLGTFVFHFNCKIYNCFLIIINCWIICYYQVTYYQVPI